MKKLIIAIYYHPEAYPPTLNAINELATVYDEIHLLYRPNLVDFWTYPENVKTYASGKRMSVMDQAKLHLFNKVFLFLQFCFLFFYLVIKNKPKMILVYDVFPLLTYHLCKKILFFEHKIWYHNHDVPDFDFIRKYSIAWFACKVEKVAFRYLNIFSLPADERKIYFNFVEFTGRYFLLPNYPAKKVYNQYYVEKRILTEAILIYQGRIAESHGLEIITSLLNNNINGINLCLNLKGISSSEFQQVILNVASENNSTDRIKFLGMGAYIDVPIEGNKAHIGIGIFLKNDVMNSTIGTASNKLYEYAAMGLPVLYYDSDYFNKHLGKYKWAVKCKMNKESILGAIKYIIGNYIELCDKARDDFNHSLNFEEGFAPISKFLNEK